MRRDQTWPTAPQCVSAELRGARGDQPRPGRRTLAAGDRGRVGTLGVDDQSRGRRQRRPSPVPSRDRGPAGVGQDGASQACKLAPNPVLAGIVTEKLQRRWSPQQIAGWLKLTHPDDPEMHVSHESIYRTLFVQSRGALRKELTAYLRTGRAIQRSHGCGCPMVAVPGPGS
jgi:hypothetical protein